MTVTAYTRDHRAAPLATALREGALDLDAHIDATLRRVEECEPVLRALLPEPGRAARLHADAATLRARHPDVRTRPPLYGLLVGIKDIINVEGLPARAGSALPAEAFATPEASLVRRLREAGALVLGKTVTAEFASYAPGATANPVDPRHTPGGSSSGSAAAVAAGYAPLAIGSQTGGSITRPAAFCGIVGFKPSYQRAPIDGTVFHAPSVDTLGPFAQDVEGVRLAASVIVDDWRPSIALTRPPVIGVPVGAFLQQTEPEALEEFQAAVHHLSTLGLDVRYVGFLDDVADVVARHSHLMTYEFRRTHEPLFARWGSLYTGLSAQMYDDARHVTDEQYRHGIDGRLELRERITRVLDSEGLDAWVSPSALGPAPLGLRSTGQPSMNVPWSHSGVPTVTLPAGHVHGMPVGLQLSGRFGQDEELLALAASVEALLRDHPR